MPSEDDAAGREPPVRQSPEPPCSSTPTSCRARAPCRCCRAWCAPTLVDRNLTARARGIREPPLPHGQRARWKRPWRFTSSSAMACCKSWFPRRRLFSSTTYLVILGMVGSFARPLRHRRPCSCANQVRPIRQLAGRRRGLRQGPRQRPPSASSAPARCARPPPAFNQNARPASARQIAQRTEMLAGVSHDLRTPRSPA